MIRRIGWLVLAGVWLFLAASLWSFTPYDAPGHAAAPLNERATNWCGWVGAWAAYQSLLMLGPGIWVLVAGIASYLGATLTGRKPDQVAVRALGLLTMALSVSAYLQLFLPVAGPFPEGSGGLIAIAAISELLPRFNFLGTAILLTGCFGVGALMAVDELVLALPRQLASAGHWVAGLRLPRPAFVGAIRNLSLPGFGRREQTRETEPAEDTEDVGPAVRKFERNMSQIAVVIDDEVEAQDSEEQESEPDVEAAHDEEVSEEEHEDNDDDEAQEEAAAHGEPRKPLDEKALREKIKNLPISFSGQTKPKGPPAVPQQDLSGYRFPDLSLLAEPESNFCEQIERLVREQAMKLEQALRTFRIDAQVVDIHSGPVITLYDVQPAPGVKVSQFNNVASDIARQLKAQNIRIVPNTAGKTTIGIEVPNPLKEKVRIKELMALGGADLLEKMRLPMFLGKDASGAPLIADLATMPHMLIAGTTGSGKSVCMNSIIMSFLFTRRPDELKLVLVDPKMVEMSQFKDVPHLMCPVVTEMNRAAAILEWAVTKMDERYELMAEATVRDIDGYNKLSWEELKEVFKPQNEQEEAHIPKKLPRLVFIVDELADLMITNKEVENLIVRIAQKARAVGIHLILATQRPEAKVVTGLIKANMPCRVAFKVASGLDSRIVLDQRGAELLLGQGDMLYLSPRNSKLMRAQATLVDDAEVRATVRFLKEVAQPSFEPQLVQLKAPGTGGVEDTGERDPMFEDSVRIVLEAQRGSVSLLQRRLGIGYGRASRIIDEMAMAGILGDHKGTQAREVVFTLEEWEAAKALQAKDAAVEVNGAIPDEQADADEKTETAGYGTEYESGSDADEDEEKAKPSDGYKEYEYVEDDESA